jgi:hypothetical protein
MKTKKGQYMSVEKGQTNDTYFSCKEKGSDF